MTSSSGDVDVGASRLALSRLLEARIGDVRDVRREPLLYDAFQAGRSVSRVTGRAQANGGDAAWSLIEKVTEGPGIASPYLYDNGLREFEAYRSGVLSDLAPDLAAPRLLESTKSPDGRLTLWLEDVGAATRRPLSREELLAAARHLGRLAGRWRGRVPDHRWLFHGWLDRHSQPEAVDAALGVLHGVEARGQIEARLGRGLPAARRLIEDQPLFKSALARLTPTLCHHDAVAANVFPRTRDESGETVLIDWESIGPGPPGADLASLLFSSARRGDLSARDVPALLGPALDAYAGGMADLAEAIDPSQLRLAVFAAIALRWTLARDVVRAMEGASSVFRGSSPGESAEESLEQLLALTTVLFDAEAEARRLLLPQPASSRTSAAGRSDHQRP